MRIAIIDPSLYTTPYDTALIEGLQSCGHEVRLFGRTPRATDVPLGAGVDLCPHFYRRTERWRGNGAASWISFAKAMEHCSDVGRLGSVLEGFGPDVVHWQWPSVPLIDAWALRRLRRKWPQVLTVHDTNLFHRAGLARIRTYGWDDFIRSADEVIVHMESSRRILLDRGIGAERMTVVRHGVFSRPTGSRRAPPESQTQAGARRLRILFFGRITLNKGVQTLIEAMSLVEPRLRSKAELQVAGALQVAPRTWQAMLDRANLGSDLKVRAEFIPEDDLDRLLATSDVVVFPHLDVDASGALMKAVAYDVAVIASDIPPFLETMAQSGAALFHKAGDPKSLAMALEAVIRNEALRTQLRSRLRVLRSGDLSWQVLAMQTAEVYSRARQRKAR